MTARSGFVTYTEYVAGSDKGGVAQGDLFNSGIGQGLGKIDEDRARFTSNAIVEVADAAGATAWKPVAGKVERYDGLDSEGKPIWTEIEVAAIAQGDKIRYQYDNEIIPANDLPIINARTREIPLIAKARRIAVYYSQLAAFEMKMEMGEDLGQNLSEQAVSELKFEIDNEIIFFLKNMAGEALLKFNKALPVGVNKRDHYDSFLEIVEKGRTALYERTMRYSPNYMVCAMDVLQVLGFCTGFKAANAKNINGPFMAGTLNGMKVIVSPALKSGEFFFGVNEGNVSAAVYAPYMAIVPTQLLGYADGGMSQGYSTLYALAKLNERLVIAGKIVEEPQVSYWKEA